LTPYLYFGSDDFSRSVLEGLLELAPPLAIVTQPDRPAGRNQQLRSGPLALLAKERGIPLLQPEHLKEQGTQNELLGLGAELLIVVSFGQIIPRSFLERCPPIINGHASLLPRFRGASPIQSAILAGDGVTGMTIMHIVPKLDAGPMICKEVVEILPSDDHGSLSKKLIASAIRLLTPVVEGVRVPPGEAQVEALSTHCSKLDKDDAQLRPDCQDGVSLSRTIRAFSPHPGAHLFIGSGKGPRRLKILKAILCDPPPPNLAPGLHRQGKNSLILAGCDGVGLSVLVVQPEGKDVMPVAAYLNGVQGDLQVVE